MYKQEELIDKVEKLEREIWFLVKNSLPKLKEDILASLGQGGGNQGLASKVEEHTALIAELTNGIANINYQLSSMTTQITNVSKLVDINKDDIATNTENISKHEEGIAANRESITVLQTNVSACIGSLGDCNTKISNLTKQINANTSNIATNAEDIQKLSQKAESSEAEIISLSNSISTIQADVSTNSENLQSLSSSVATNSQSIANNSQAITTISDKTAELDTRITGLENASGGSGGGRTIEVFYDMNSTDEAINQTFTAGLKTNKAVYWKNDYDFIRIYANLNNCFAYGEFPVNNRPKDDITLQTSNVTGKISHRMRGIFYNNLKRFNLGMRSTYTYNTDGSITFENSISDSFFITRMEGVIGN